MAIYYGRELYHFGIKGQKWGVKNGPPYPLGEDDYSSAEKKQSKKFHLSDKQKKYIKIGAAVAATALVAYGGYKLYQNGYQIKGYVNLGKKNMDFIKDGGFDKIAPPLSSFETLTKEPTGNTSALANSIVERMQRDDGLMHGYTSVEDICKLSDNELRCLQAYTTPKFYRQINEVADGLANGYDQGYFAGYDDTVKGMAKEIMSAMEKVTLQKDAQVQRGIDDSACRRLLGNSVFSKLEEFRSQSLSSGGNLSGLELPNLKDMVVPSRGFSSTAVPFQDAKGKKHSTADYFSTSRGIIFELTAKSGQHAIDISHISELGAEREILFATNSDIVANGKVDIIDGIIHVYGELIQR